MITESSQSEIETALRATNPKSEARNPKEIPMTKIPIKAGVFIGIWHLGFAWDFGFRASDLPCPSRSVLVYGPTRP
jgi:hypothetical protein